MAKTYGYIRVSTREQNEDRQVIALSAFDIPPENLFMDKLSGKDFNRPAYKRMIKKLKPGDTLIVSSIDRLGRNYDEILEQWRIITKQKAVDIRVIDMPLLDTSVSRDLTGTLISDIVLQLLSYVAQSERENNRQRQAEGIAAAKSKGVAFGRPPIALPENFYQVCADWKNKKISSRQAATKLNASQSTFLKWVTKFGEKSDRLCQKTNV